MADAIDNTLIVSLSDAASLDTSLLGGKAANLARLRELGVNIPRGAVITTTCYRAFVAENGIEAKIASALGDLTSLGAASLETASEKIRRAFATSSISTFLARRISIEFENAGRCVVVRSSANAEDLAEASFAGLHDSVLNVQSPESLLSAIIQCWASLWTARAIAYRAKFGVANQSVAMGVLVHEFLPASNGGVLFTQNPITGDKSQMVINATYGIGESLVGGTITPDEIVMDKKSERIVCQSIAKKAERIEAVRGGGLKSSRVYDASNDMCSVNDDEIDQLMHLGKIIEQGFGCSMDIEWVSEKGSVRVVQARPITIAGMSKRDVKNNNIPHMLRLRLLGMLLEYFPAPMYPFDRGALLSLVEVTLRKLEEPGLKLPGAQACFPMYQTGEIEPLASLPRFSFLSIPKFIRFLWKIACELRANPRVFVKCFLPKLTIELKLLPSDLTELDSHQLTELFTRAQKMRDEVFLNRNSYFWSGWIAITLLQMLLKVCRGHQWGGAYFKLTTGLDLPTARIKREMESLQDLVKSALQSELTSGAVPMERIDAALESGSVRKRFDEFISRHGSRTFDMIPMPTSRSWRDSPEIIVRTLKDLSHRKNSSHTIPDDEPISLKGFSGFLIRLLLPRVREMTVERDNVIRAYEEATVPLRSIMWEAGRRLELNEILLSKSDIKFLDPAEAFQALIGREDKIHSGLKQMVINRQFARPITIHNWRKPIINNTRISTRGAVLLRGLAASPGVVKGRAVIILEENDFERIKDGDILVCVASNPAWTTLFGRASAVVADLGGPLSHAAIVAREFAIPAVLDTKCATSELCEGEVYIVDGTLGLVMNSDTKDHE